MKRTNQSINPLHSKEAINKAINIYKQMMERRIGNQVRSVPRVLLELQQQLKQENNAEDQYNLLDKAILSAEQENRTKLPLVLKVARIACALAAKKMSTQEAQQQLQQLSNFKNNKKEAQPSSLQNNNQQNQTFVNSFSNTISNTISTVSGLARNFVEDTQFFVDVSNLIEEVKNSVGPLAKQETAEGNEEKNTKHKKESITYKEEIEALKKQVQILREEKKAGLNKIQSLQNQIKAQNILLEIEESKTKELQQKLNLKDNEIKQVEQRNKNIVKLAAKNLDASTFQARVFKISRQRNKQEIKKLKEVQEKQTIELEEKIKLLEKEKAEKLEKIKEEKKLLSKQKDNLEQLLNKKDELLHEKEGMYNYKFQEAKFITPQILERLKNYARGDRAFADAKHRLDEAYKKIENLRTTTPYDWSCEQYDKFKVAYDIIFKEEGYKKVFGNHLEEIEKSKKMLMSKTNLVNKKEVEINRDKMKLQEAKKVVEQNLQEAKKIIEQNQKQMEELTNQFGGKKSLTKEETEKNEENNKIIGEKAELIEQKKKVIKQLEKVIKQKIKTVTNAKKEIVEARESIKQRKKEIKQNMEKIFPADYLKTQEKQAKAYISHAYDVRIRRYHQRLSAKNNKDNNKDNNNIAQKMEKRVGEIEATIKIVGVLAEEVLKRIQNLEQNSKGESIVLMTAELAGPFAQRNEKQIRKVADDSLAKDLRERKEGGKSSSEKESSNNNDSDQQVSLKI